MRNESMQFTTIDEIQRWAIERVLVDGITVAPRDLSTLELRYSALTLSNPRARCTINPMRRWSLPLALGEFCWHVSASDELDELTYYAKRWREFSEDDHTLRGSCYGKRIFGRPLEGPNQWDRAINLLRADPSTRRAILNLQGLENTLSVDAKDVACAITLQFLIRAGRLHAVVYMRSNDIFLGLPYDIFLFTMLQELMASQIGIELGEYHHIAASLHLYERDIGRAKAVLETPCSGSFEMPPMTSVDEVTTFLSAEERIRITGASAISTFSLSKYWNDLVDVFLLFRARKHALISDLQAHLDRSPYKEVLRPYFDRERA